MDKFYSLIPFFNLVKEFYEFLIDRKDSNNNSIVEAHKAIDKAYSETKNYIKESNGAGVQNSKLSDLWSDAAHKVMILDKFLGEALLNKSRFWSDPDLYFITNSDENVITLNKIYDEMEMLRMKLK